MSFQMKTLVALAMTAVAASAASADYLPGNMSAVQNLAQQMENDSAQARYEAQRYAGYGNWAEQDAIDRLIRLEQAAQDFDRAVDNYYYNPSNTRYEFDRLNSEFISASGLFSRLTAYRYVKHLFDNMQTHMMSLRYYYSDSYYPTPQPPYYPQPQPPYYPQPRPPYYPQPQPPYYPPHQPGRPNPPARPIPNPPYYPAPQPPYRPQPPVYQPPRPQPHPGNPGHTPGRPNPPARPCQPGRC